MGEALETFDPLLGEVINEKYRVVSQLGRGGMGVVYAAEQIALSRTVALKVLRADRDVDTRDPAFRERFTREASLCARLSHPNVVTVFDFGAIESPAVEGIVGGYFIAMEHLAGETLSRRLKRTPTLPLEDTLRIVGEIARGLREAHRCGLIHRDLKPANVMLIEHPEEAVERVKLFDFGLVKHVESEGAQEITREGSFLGSPRYIAPEQISGEPVDQRADLYALGIIFYQCLAGVTPFEGGNSTQVMLARLTSVAPRLRERNALCEVPAEVEALVLQLLERSPADRFASVSELLAAMRGVSEALGFTFGAALNDSRSQEFSRAPSGPRAAPPPLPALRPAAPAAAPAVVPAAGDQPGRRWRVAPLLVVPLLLAAAAVLLWSRPRGERPSVEPSPRARPAETLVDTASTAAPSAVPTAAPTLVPAVALAVDAAVVPARPPTALAVAPRAAPTHPRLARGPAEEAPRGEAPPAPSAQPPAAVVAPAPSEDGFLTLDTSPWTLVSLRGRELGTTPLVRVALPPGAHTLSLRNPDLGVNQSITVTVRAGATTVLRRNLDSP